MLTKKRFHALIVLLSILSFFAPVKFQGSTTSAAVHFLINGTLTTAFYTISLVFGPIGRLITEPSRITNLQQLNILLGNGL